MDGERRPPMNNNMPPPYGANISTAFPTSWSSQLGSSNYGNEGHSNFDVSDFLEFDSNDWFNESPPPRPSSPSTLMMVSFTHSLNNFAMANDISGSSTLSPHAAESPNSNSAAGGYMETTKERVAIRTKSQVEILTDGFKWRKYGKKVVKHSPHPRNYFKCSVDGCEVKKRVERDRDDPTYIITTYEGTHNHPSHG